MILRSLVLALILLGVSSQAQAKVVLKFDGHLDLKQKQFKINVAAPQNTPPSDTSGNVPQPSGSVALKARQISGSQYDIQLVLDKVNTAFCNLSMELKSLVRVDSVTQAGIEAEGTVSSSYTLVNYKPFEDISARFKIEKNLLSLSPFKIGANTYEGTLKLVYPHEVTAKIDLAELDMNDFLDFWMAKRQFDSAGNVVGVVNVTGTLADPYVKARLESYNGFVKQLAYDSIVLNLEGFFPQLNVMETVVSETNGLSFVANGPIDVSDREQFAKQIKALSLSPLVKESADKAEWTIRSNSQSGSGKTELKYLLRHDPNKKQAEGSDALLGIQRKMEF